DIGATKHLTVKPAYIDGIDHASASTGTIFGPVSTAWQRSGEKFALDLTVPAGTTASVHVPAAAVSDVGEGRVRATDSPGVSFEEMEGGYAVFTVGSGNYRFVSEPGFRPDTSVELKIAGKKIKLDKKRKKGQLKLRCAATE